MKTYNIKIEAVLKIKEKDLKFPFEYKKECFDLEHAINKTVENFLNDTKLLNVCVSSYNIKEVSYLIEKQLSKEDSAAIAKLKSKILKLENSLIKASEKSKSVINNMGWGEGMRKNKCTPSFKQEDEIKSKISDLQKKIDYIIVANTGWKQIK